MKTVVAVIALVLANGSSSFARTYAPGPITGIGRHQTPFMEAVTANLPALNATDSIAGTGAVACSTSVRETGLMAEFILRDTGADTVIRRIYAAYHDISDIAPVTALVFTQLRGDSADGTVLKTDAGTPVIALKTYRDKASRYRATEEQWMEQGAPLREWREYYRTQDPMDEWAQKHHYDERTATLLGVLPCSSGHLYTRQLQIGIFWSVSELALLAYGLTRSDPFQRGVILSALVPLTALDGLMSRIAARKSNETTDSIQDLYPDHKYPFDFMK